MEARRQTSHGIPWRMQIVWRPCRTSSSSQNAQQLCPDAALRDRSTCHGCSRPSRAATTCDAGGTGISHGDRHSETGPTAACKAWPYDDDAAALARTRASWTCCSPPTSRARCRRGDRTPAALRPRDGDRARSAAPRRRGRGPARAARLVRGDRRCARSAGPTTVAADAPAPGRGSVGCRGRCVAARANLAPRRDAARCDVDRRRGERRARRDGGAARHSGVPHGRWATFGGGGWLTLAEMMFNSALLQGQRGGLLRRLELPARPRAARADGDPDLALRRLRRRLPPRRRRARRDRPGRLTARLGIKGSCGASWTSSGGTLLDLANARRSRFIATASRGPTRW